jgi:hypothetical protein
MLHIGKCLKKIERDDAEKHFFRTTEHFARRIKYVIDDTYINKRDLDKFFDKMRSMILGLCVDIEKDISLVNTLVVRYRILAIILLFFHTSRGEFQFSNKEEYLRVLAPLFATGIFTQEHIREITV